MKKLKIFIVMILCCTICIISGCGAYPFHSEMHGVNEFSDGIPVIGRLIPPYKHGGGSNEGVVFPTMFESVSRDFYYTFDEHEFVLPITETSLYYFEYADDVYENAKNYIYDNSIFSEYNIFHYNGYCFVENLSWIKSDVSITDRDSVEEIFESESKNFNYPYEFYLFGYNDEKKILIFIGFEYSYAVTKNKDKYYDPQLVENDFEAFLKKYYYYYDFDA